jgi:hypothetical protein
VGTGYSAAGMPWCDDGQQLQSTHRLAGLA